MEKITMHNVLSRRQILIGLCAASAFIYAFYFFLVPLPPIKVGILHSVTGSLALSEKSVIDAELLAIDEINAAGGVLKRKLVPIIADGKSDELVFAQEAERLIKDEKVAVIIGCWTSASRKAVKPVVEKYDSLLVYPISYEGLEESPNILNVGATQNQQIVPGALWSFYNLGKKFFLVGSDYIFCRAANEIMSKNLGLMKATILGQEYIELGSTNVKEMIQKIITAKPDVIINTIQGESNIAFFNELRAQGITPEKIPVMSISSVSETEFAQIGASAMTGDYVTASYFQSIEREENHQFVANYKKKFGQNRVVSETEDAGYSSVFIWSKAVVRAGSPNPIQTRKHLLNIVFNAPGGIIYTDNKLFNTWKTIYVGKLRSDGQFTIVWDSEKQVQPINFPNFKSQKEWEQFINNWYEEWGGRWSKRT